MQAYVMHEQTHGHSALALDELQAAPVASECTGTGADADADTDAEGATADRLTIAQWKTHLAQYEKPSRWRATVQIVDTLGPYILVWYAMYLSMGVSWWLTIPLAALSGLLIIRVFIIFHDCGHGSYFRSHLANDITGFIAGMLSFTPYYHWRWQHGLHHATAGDLDRRGTGDIWTMTVQEYLESGLWKRFAYKLSRNPIVLFVIAPLFLFVFRQRIPSRRASPRERRSVWWMNLALAGMVTVLSLVFGFVPYLFIQLTASVVTGAAGVWLFYVQHQFEDAYWERGDDWDYTVAALQGSSYYKLPAPLRWLSGNIGFHHVHHLSSRIPNYHLEACHDSHPLFQQVKPVTLLASWRTMFLKLWDERGRKLVGFRHARAQRRENAARARDAKRDAKRTAQADAPLSAGASHGEHADATRPHGQNQSERRVRANGVHVHAQVHDAHLEGQRGARGRADEVGRAAE